MAISPKFAMQLTSDEKERVATLEAEIDMILEAEFSGKEYQMSIKRLSDGQLTKIPERIFRGLSTKYTEAGWKLEQIEVKEQTITSLTGIDKDVPIYKLTPVHNLLFSMK